MSRIPGYVLPGELVRPAGQVPSTYAVKPQAQARPSALSPSATLSFAQGGPFSAAEFFSTYISCANWASMTAARRQATMQGYYTASGRSWLLGPGGLYPSWAAPGSHHTPPPPPPTQQQLQAAILAANAYCLLGAATPHAAGQALSPQPTQVTTNQQNQLVDQSGNVMTDANGNPVQFSGHTYHAGPVKALLALALFIGVPAFLGSYFGSKGAE